MSKMPMRSSTPNVLTCSLKRSYINFEDRIRLNKLIEKEAIRKGEDETEEDLNNPCKDMGGAAGEDQGAGFLMGSMEDVNGMMENANLEGGAGCCKVEREGKEGVEGAKGMLSQVKREGVMEGWLSPRPPFRTRSFRLTDGCGMLKEFDRAGWGSTNSLNDEEDGRKKPMFFISSGDESDSEYEPRQRLRRMSSMDLVEKEFPFEEALVEYVPVPVRFAASYTQGRLSRVLPLVTVDGPNGETCITTIYESEHGRNEEDEDGNSVLSSSVSSSTSSSSSQPGEEDTEVEID